MTTSRHVFKPKTYGYGADARHLEGLGRALAGLLGRP